MNTSTMPHMVPHPRPVTKERPIPVELWPDNKGVLKAKVKEWKNTASDWEKFWKLAARFPLVSVDTETSGLRPFHGSRIVGVGAAFYDGKDIQAGYWNFRHQGHLAHPWCSRHDSETKPATRKACENCKRGTCPGYVEKAIAFPVAIMADMLPVFQNCIIGGQNFKFDERMFSVEGVPVPRRVVDTKLIAHLWDENKRGNNLDNLAKEIGEKKLGDTVKEYMEEHSLDVSKTGHAEVPYEVERPYGLSDTVIVLKRLQWERERWEAADDPKLMEIFQVENACSPAVGQMEINGIKLDMDYVRAGIVHIEKELGLVQAAIYKESKKEFDVLSTQQLWEVLEARGLKPLATTPNGAPSLGANELEAYARAGDTLVDMILEYRSKHKILNTYLKPFRDEHADPNGFIHSDFFIDGTVSGRMSSREPNLQNMSRPEAFMASNTLRGATAKMIQSGVDKFVNTGQTKVQIRRCFVPRTKDHSMFFFDYSQMELRIFAEYADEKFILDGLLRDHVDIHELVAREIFPNFPDKEVNPLLYKFFRQLTKQINFGIIYGMGRNKLALQLSVPVDESVRLLKMVQQARAEGLPEGRSACVMDDDEIVSYLEDHRVMTASRQWDGLRSLGKEVQHKVDPEPLVAVLFTENRNLGLLYSAESFLAKYHARFPKIKAFTKGLDKVVKNRGWIFNKYGRRYHLRPEESYIGVNRLVQGTTADQVKVAKWRVHRLLQGTKSCLINQVHDEVQADIHHSELHLVPMIREAMEYYPNIGVKMEVDTDYSHTSWAEKKKWTGEEEFMASLGEIRGQEKGSEGKGAKKTVAKGQPVVRVTKGRKAAVPR